MIAQLRKVRFISADSASQASRSSPSMSSSNSCASESSPRSMRERDIAQAPHRERVFVGDEAERAHPRALEPARQQHAERLVREAALERIADEIILGGARKRLDQQFAGLRQQRAPLLDLQPLAHLIGQARARRHGFASMARTRAAR